MSNGNMFQVTYKVRNFECDHYGHVNNAIYLNYLELSRTEFFEQKGLTLNRLKDAGYMLVVRRIDVIYRCPAFAGDILAIQTCLKYYRKIRATFYQQIVRQSDQKVTTQADVEWVVVNLNGRPVAIPPLIYEILGVKD